MMPIVLALSIVTAACNGDRAAAPAASAPMPMPAPTSAPAHEPPFHLVLGEATVIELGATEQPVFKLHADGSIEQRMTFKHKPAEWWKLGVIAADGTLSNDGKVMGTLADSYTQPHRDGAKMAIDGNAIASTIVELWTFQMTSR